MQKKTTNVEFFCDVCGKKADGLWRQTTTVNDDTSDWVPFDLCKTHAKDMGDMMNGRSDYEDLSRTALLKKLKAYCKRRDDKRAIDKITDLHSVPDL